MYPLVAESTVNAYWWISLAIGLVVTIVVALLLLVLARTAEQIEAGAAEVWRVGKLIANNTIHVPLLVRTNQVVAEILAATGGIAAATERIARAATGGRPDERG